MPVPTPKPSLSSSVIGADDAVPGVVTTAQPTFNIIAEVPAPASDTPTFIKSLRHVYCVEFARIRSGIAIFGDAKTWWDHAKGQYARGTYPLPGAVMVFSAVRKMRHGHVAVVKRVVSSREVVIDHANWGRNGDIYLNAPVIDVSEKNDWSKVRVWNTHAGTMGTNVYPIKGFVSRTAWN
ncbi:MAG TPA: CHAP domain-containing protein [Rhizomicrobium sp.]